MPAQRLPASDVGLLTDRYEFTMLRAAMQDGSAERICTFEVFARRLPPGRRFGVAAGIGRLLGLIDDFSFDPQQLDALVQSGALDDRSATYLTSYRFAGTITGLAEGEPYFPDTPMLAVTGTFAETVVLETLILSVLNHDCAIAAAAARMVLAAGDRPVLDMGSRRTHEDAAVAAARAAYLTGFSATSNMAAGLRYGIPTAGTAAHAFTLLHDTERTAFGAQISALGTDTTLLVDTYDVPTAIATAIEVAGVQLGAIRIDSGDLAASTRDARRQLDALGAVGTQIVLSGDLDEFAINSLAAVPADAYGVGTALVTGSGAPTASLVYKLVEVDGRPVEKLSEAKATRGGRKAVYRRHGQDHVAETDLVAVIGAGFEPGPSDRLLTRDYLVDGQLVTDLPSLSQSRAEHRTAMAALPVAARQIGAGDPALSVVKT